ncbi:MAG: DUF502 domain-containing protein [Myxococcota bacterium]
MKQLANYFLQGLLFLVPIAVTVYVFVSAFLMIDSWLRISTPGLGILILVASTTLAGFLVSTFFAGRISKAADRLFQHLPLAKLIYTAVKDLLSAFVGEKKRFDQPVLVELHEGQGISVIGFVTQKSLAQFGRPDLVAVYLPQSYAFAGMTILVPQGRVRPLEVEAADAMAFLVSGGVSLSTEPQR